MISYVCDGDPSGARRRKRPGSLGGLKGVLTRRRGQFDLADGVEMSFYYSFPSTDEWAG